MKYALVNGSRAEAAPGLRGECLGCASPMIARCGEVRLNHWSHKGRLRCDPWWENETEWHRAWKNRFPQACQEVVHKDNDGQRHIADVKSPGGWVIEFQHSPIQPEERRARENFYKRLIWVVDGTRRKRDKGQFFAQLEDSLANRSNSLFKQLVVEGALLSDWVTSQADVVFDFGGDTLWHQTTDRAANWVWVFPTARRTFIELTSASGNSAAEGWPNLVSERTEAIGHLKAQQQSAIYPPPRRKARTNRRYPRF